MLGILANRRALWVIGMLAAILIASSAATAADHTTDVIHIDIEGRTATFTYGNTVQAVSTTSSPCHVPSDQLDGPVLDLSASSYTWNGHPVSGFVGIKNDTLGVNRTGQGNSHWCKKIDYLGHGRSEALDISLAEAPASDGKVISSAVLNLKVWHYAKVKIEFFSDGEKVGEQIRGLHAGYRTINADPGVFFDHVRLSAKKGSFGLRSSSLHLEGTLASVAIDARTNSTDNPTLEARNDGGITPDDVLWTYLITNTGDQDLVSFTLSDPAVEGAIGGAISCDATSIASGDSVTCSAMGTAEPGQFTNTATVDAVGEFGDEVTASDGSGYFGSLPAVSVVKATNGSQAFINIPAGDPITWTYEVTNTGNGELSGIAVSDDRLLGAVSCPHTSLAAGASMTCSASGVAERSTEGVNYVNVGTVIATPLVGPEVTASDEASYFGFVATLEIGATAAPPDGVVVAGEPVTFDFTIENTGNVPIDEVRVAEVGGTDPVNGDCDFGTVAPGAIETCTFGRTVGDGEDTIQFAVRGSDPNEGSTEALTGEFGVFGGLACGEGQTNGGPGLNDTPLAGFVVGPDKGDPTNPDACAVPVDIMTGSFTDEGGQEFQTADVGPPSDIYDWTGVTGVVTIEWDAAERDLGDLPRTLQVFDDADPQIIPFCAEVVPVVLGGDGNYELQDPSQVYADATAGGDVCLILQNTVTVEVTEGVVGTQTTEAFYLFNDPGFVRPR